MNDEIKELTTLPQTQAPAAVPQSQQLAPFGSIGAFEQAQRVAKALMSADITPESFRGNMGNCLIAMEMSARTGASLLAVMQSIVIVNGNPGWKATFLIGSINTSGRFSPLRYEMTGKQGSDSWGCRAWAYDLASQEKLIGPEVTISMAKHEGWFQRKGSKWQTMPEVMLRYRGATFWTRQYAPEISLGMPTGDELQDIGATVVEPVSLAEIQSGTATSAAEDTKPPVQQCPIRVGQGEYDWQDADGIEYAAAVDAKGKFLFAWNTPAGMPAINDDGTFRAGRGKAGPASMYRQKFIASRQSAGDEEAPSADKPPPEQEAGWRSGSVRQEPTQDAPPRDQEFLDEMDAADSQQSAEGKSRSQEWDVE